MSATSNKNPVENYEPTNVTKPTRKARDRKLMKSFTESFKVYAGVLKTSAIQRGALAYFTFPIEREASGAK